MLTKLSVNRIKQVGGYPFDIRNRPLAMLLIDILKVLPPFMAVQILPKAMEALDYLFNNENATSPSSGVRDLACLAFEPEEMIGQLQGFSACGFPLLTSWTIEYGKHRLEAVRRVHPDGDVDHLGERLLFLFNAAFGNLSHGTVEGIT